MSIVNKIKSISNHLTDAYNSLENIGVDLTNIDKNIENLSTQIESVYNDLPKITDEDTEITLSPTKKGKMSLVLKGNTSQDGEPTPDSPQDIHTVSGDNKVVVCGKNLAEEKISNANVYSDGRLLAGDYDIYIAKIEQNKVYTVSTNDSQLNAGFFTTKPKIGSTAYDNLRLVQTSKTFTAPITGYIAFKTNVGYAYAQCEVGSTATEYEEHKEQTYSINLGSMELCKIGDYQDYLYKENGIWYKYGAIGKVVLDGSEDWNYDIAGGFNRFSTLISNSYVGTGRQACLSNYFKNNLTSNADGICFIVNGNVYLYKNDITTANDFKTWLGTHNTTVYYVLATPTITEITDTTLIEQLDNLEKAYSYDTQTNISQTNQDKPFILNVSALKKNSSN